ncbi:MAG: hypothetical protein WCR33_01170 [Bacilli bacterium]
MSKITKKAKQLVKDKEFDKRKPVVNFMGGISYDLNPIDTLKMISASSILGEPQYYRKDGLKDIDCSIHDFVKDFSVFDYKELSASSVMKNAIQNALNFDFKATIEWASSLRNEFYMRLNPQMIMVMAAQHQNRVEFDKANPGVFRGINSCVMKRADEPASQLSCYLYLNDGKKNGIPNILKRSWKERLERADAYSISKYKNTDIGMINTVRVCHANSPRINELMKTGTVNVTDGEETWERLRSAGVPFKEIWKKIRIPHMALLKNLRNIFSELDTGDIELAEEILLQLKGGVLGSMQFPFRYYNAYRVISGVDEIAFGGKILDALDECIDISVENLPKLSGRTACLSDNSGSAWGAFNSEYGSVTVADIDNLSSVLIGACSDDADVFKFGDDIKRFDVRKREGILSQAKKISDRQYEDVGGHTEHGIWLFFKNAIRDKIHYDNIFIFSDQQAGHGGLYGTESSYLIDGENFRCRAGKYVDVMRLLDKYRKTVNPKVNFFTVQTAGYTNVVIPEYTYRGAVLYGWTGKESLFASNIIKQWDDIERRVVQVK